MGYDLSLYSLAQQELKAAVDSAALAAGATTASSNNTDPTTTQESAMSTAMNMFQLNSVIGQSLATATESSTVTMNPAANQAQVYFQFLDPVTKNPVALGSTNGKIIQVTAAFGFSPPFAQFIGLSGTFNVVATADGGLPMLDIVLCFDISASMDDFTPVTIVDRYKGSNGNTYNILAQGPLYTAFQCTNATGTPLNACFPQELDGGDGAYAFDANARGTNHGAAASSGKVANNFTDVVVNIDGTNTMSNGTTVSYNGGSFSFPANNSSNNIGLGILVEASRGNLESTAIADNAGVPYASWNITPQAGWYGAYQQAALLQRHPIQDAITAAQNFFTIMNNDCDVHFGLVTFSSNAGTTANQTCTSDIGANAIGYITDSPSAYSSNAYPTDTMNPTPPNPGISLNPTAGPTYSNYSTVNSSVASLVQYGGTNISGALQAALSQMETGAQGGQNLCRAGASKAIVLFTDGLPTVSSLGGDPQADARTEAVAAENAGIPIYCIGLCLTPTLQASQTAILTDQNSSPSSGGIAGISGNGATFYQATQTSELDAVFENVARALVQLVRQ